MKTSFIGEPIIPDDTSFAVSDMAEGAPGLPCAFTWNGRHYQVLELIEHWKQTGDCHHGSGERYVRKHWFRVRVTGDLEMRLYFERQRRSSGGSRWRLYSIAAPTPPANP